MIKFVQFDIKYAIFCIGITKAHKLCLVKHILAILLYRLYIVIHKLSTSYPQAVYKSFYNPYKLLIY